MKYEDVDTALFTWFCNARSRNIPVDGTILQEKAVQLAKLINPSTTFLASNGWLEKFINRHDIVFRSLCGESASVNIETVEAWKHLVPTLCTGYEAKDIFNIDETGLLYRQQPRKTYIQRGDQGKGGKDCKQRLTVCLFTNALGQKEDPIIIGNAKRPRCFGKLDVEKQFKIIWRSNKKSWMTALIFEEVLKTFNRKMKLEKRKVILFLDNATSHPHLNLSNVKLEFLPPNTTSECQPLDQGIIYSFKVQYRKLLMRKVVNALDANLRGDITNLAEDFTKSITVLDALSFVRQAWNLVKPETVQNCFSKCNFPVMPIDENAPDAEQLDIGIPLSDIEASEFANCDNNERKSSCSFAVY